MPETREEAVERATKGGGVGNDRGETVYWRGSDWKLASFRIDGEQVHVTLTVPRRAPYRQSTNDG